MRCSGKIRYRQRDQLCQVEQIASDRVRVVFDRPQRAVALGQSVVFYDGEVCLGGGIIEATHGGQCTSHQSNKDLASCIQD